MLGTDPAALKGAPPAFRADLIRVPVFLIHGEEDERAPIAGAKAMRRALAEQGRPPEWLVERREGHGFYDEGARERMAERLLQFLRDHTQPKPEGAPAQAP